MRKSLDKRKVSRNIFFIPGGPGMNSYAEKEFLGPCFNKKGARDPIIDSEKEIRVIERIFRAPQVTFLKECGHFAALEDPNYFSKTILEAAYSLDRK